MRERDRGLACGVGINCLCQSEIIVCIQCGCGLVKLAVLKVWCERLDLVQKEHEYCLDFYPYSNVRILSTFPSFFHRTQESTK